MGKFNDDKVDEPNVTTPTNPLGLVYTHPQDTFLKGMQYAMQYNPQNLPAARIIDYDPARLNYAETVAQGPEGAIGFANDVISIDKFGRNSAVGTNLETVWDGSNIYEYITTAGTATVTSADPDDNPTGDGAQTVSIIGVDASYNTIAETIPLGGTGTLSFFRVFRARVETAGISGTNEGVITVTVDSVSAAIIEVIGNLGLGQTEMALYTIPAGYTGCMTQWEVGSNDSGSNLYFSLNSRNIDSGRLVWCIHDSKGTSRLKVFTVPLLFLEKTDIEIRVNAGNNKLAAAGFNIILVRNPV